MKNKLSHTIDENFFSIINTEEKAYWLGFLYADGCITYSNRNKEQLVCQLQLSISDKNHLKKFHKSLSCNKILYFYTRKSKTNKIQKYVSTRLSSKKLCLDLIQHGCKQRKSLKLKFPNIPKELHNHFIRGFFDGDGGWTIRNRSGESPQIIIKLVANHNFLSKINKLLELNSNIRISNKICPKLKQLTLEGNKKVKLIYNYLYKDATIYLDRKYKQSTKHFKLVNKDV